jgi:hypothetical protein
MNKLKIKLAILLGIGLISFTVMSFVSPGSRNNADAADDLMALLKTGNSKDIAKVMASTVELAILAEENSYSKVQAEAILKDFFLKHEPSGVKLVHKLTSNASYRFTVVLLTTSNGVYRISYAMKATDGVFLLSEMRVEVLKD